MGNESIDNATGTGLGLYTSKKISKMLTNKNGSGL